MRLIGTTNAPQSDIIKMHKHSAMQMSLCARSKNDNNTKKWFKWRRGPLSLKLKK